MKFLCLFGFVALASAVQISNKDFPIDLIENQINEFLRNHRYRNTPDGPVPHSKPATHSTSTSTSTPKTVPTTAATTSTTNVISNATHEANATLAEHNSLKDEIVYLKQQYAKVRGEVDHWMDSPYHRTVILPALIGVSFGFLTILVYSLLRKCCRICNKKCSRTYMGRRQRFEVDDMKNLLDRKHESDEGI